MSMSGEKSIVKPFYLFVACHESRHRLVNFSFQRETWGGIEVSTLNNEDEAIRDRLILVLILKSFEMNKKQWKIVPTIKLIIEG